MSAHVHAPLKLRPARGGASKWSRAGLRASITENEQILPFHRIAILAFDGVQPIDRSGPAQAFATANEEGADPPCAIQVAGRSAGTVATVPGFGIAVEACPGGRIGTLVIPGGPGVHALRQDRAWGAFLLAMAARAGRVAAGRFAASPRRAGALEWAGKPLEEVILGERRAPPARPDPLLGLAQMAEAVMLTAADLDRPDPPIVFVNARFERMTAWSRAEIPGRLIGMRAGR